MNAVELRVRALQAEQTQQDARAPVQQGVERPGDPGKSDEGCGDPAARRLGMRDGPRFGHQLAEYDVQKRDGGDGNDGRDAAAREEVEALRERGEPVVEQVGDGVFRDVAQQNRSDGDAELGRGQQPVQIADRLPHQPRLAVATPNHRIDARTAGRYQRELRGDEKRVRRDQHDHGQQPQA